MDRREIMGLATQGLATLGLAAAALPARADTPVEGDGVVATDPKETITLWPGTPPGGQGVNLPPIRVVNHEPPYITPVDRAIDRIGAPMMSVFRPARPDGSALIIAPGGGYVREMLDFEGMDTARRLGKAGVTCFVLRYRLPGEGWADRQDVPLQDAQRAMRLVRVNAAHYGVDPLRIGFMGFSAGGHLACSIATRFGATVYAPIDAADQIDARPSFSVPMYPVVTMGEGCHAGSRDHLLGDNPAADMIDKYSCERHVPTDAPPSFVCLASDDTTVPPLPNGMAYYLALQKAHVPSAIHMFEVGGHGFGLARAVGKPCAVWPDLLLAWGRQHGFFKSA